MQHHSALSGQRSAAPAAIGRLAFRGRHGEYERAGRRGACACRPHSHPDPPTPPPAPAVGKRGLSAGVRAESSSKETLSPLEVLKRENELLRKTIEATGEGGLAPLGAASWGS